ncbi:MAG: AraC family transcriptional regulator [Myxococcales bacterium]|nr:AraC family transcriptional regulator [Myxococcales bacterium]
MTRHSRTHQLTANAKLLWPMLEIVRGHGHRVRDFLAAAGLSGEAVYQGEPRIELSQLFELWRRAAQLLGDPALGVRVAMLTEPNSRVSWPMPLSLFEHLGLVSATLADAIAIQSQYMRLLRDGISTAIEIDGNEALFRMDFLPEEPPVLVEFDFGTALNIARRVTGRELIPREVWFTHPAPADISAHARLFRAPLRFEAPFNGIVGVAEDYTRPLLTANERFRSQLVRQADRLLSELPSVDRFEDKVCARIEAELPGGNTNASAVAEKLGISCRTLHRRLQHEGTSYQDLLDRVRFRLSVRFLRGGKAIGEVATLVGFAQASTFHRAFKSWTGDTPAEYQDRHRSAPLLTAHRPAPTIAAEPSRVH